MDDQELIDHAIAVGAAVLDDEGRVHVGCNVENASYPEGTCAETGAIAAMVAAGSQKIVAIAVAGGSEKLTSCTPCGGCRQRIRQFAEDDTRIIVIDDSDDWRTYTMKEFLPSSFHLDADF